MRLIITDIPQCLVRIFNDRRTLIGPHRGNPLDGIGDLICIRDHDFLRLLRSEIRKFFQHLLRCPKIQRRLAVRIRKSFSGHNDPSINLTVRIHKMHITGCDNWLLKFLSKLYDPPVHVL